MPDADATNELEAPLAGASVAATPPLPPIVSPRLMRQATVASLAEVRRCMSQRHAEKSLAKQAFPFFGAGRDHKVFALSVEEIGDISRWFVIGDIHGDFYALSNLVDQVEALCPDFRLIFLGDLIDRGPHSEECFGFLTGLAMRLPRRVLWLAGNHDIGLLFDEGRGCFISAVAPSEFADYLNRAEGNPEVRRSLGLEFIDIVSSLPRAVSFPGGLLVTHGGFPHTDLQKRLSDRTDVEQGLQWLNSPDSLHDFTWTRISRYRNKFPNRYNSGCQYGFSDFQAFCGASTSFFPANRLLTGHEHPDGGVDNHKEWIANPALTISGFAFGSHYESPEAFTSKYRDYLVCARLRPEGMPEVLRIEVDRQDLTAFYAGELESRFSNTRTEIDS